MFENMVWYNWVGGFDHTALVVEFADSVEDKKLWPPDKEKGD